jgi:hypothetical protein
MSEDTTTVEETTAPAPDASAPEMPKFKYGFAILVSEDGGVYIEKDLSLFSIPVERESTLIEIRRYTSEILMDLQAQAAAEYTSLRIHADSQGPTS